MNNNNLINNIIDKTGINNVNFLANQLAHDVKSKYQWFIRLFILCSYIYIYIKYLSVIENIDSIVIIFKLINIIIVIYKIV